MKPIKIKMNSFVLNKTQEDIVSKAVDWYYNSSDNLFQFTGSAGTGKSVVLNEIVRRLGLAPHEIAPMSYIGASAIVMRLKGLQTARTMHSWLYEPVESIKLDAQGKPVIHPYFNVPVKEFKFVPKPLIGIKLILIDEAGAVPLALRQEVDSRGIKTIACGDANQLPPPIDHPGYLVSGKIHRLTEIMRQAENSPIVYLANRATLGLPIQYGVYGNTLVIDETQLNSDMLTRTNILLCGKNATKDSFNAMIRPLKTGCKDLRYPIHNDQLICRKNNWKISCSGINLANGLIGRVVNFPDASRFKSNEFTIDFQPIWLNVPFIDIKCDYKFFTADTNDKKTALGFGFGKGEKFEYAYAITTHISQGSEFHNGIYFEEYLNRDINNKLNYTGITRFSDHLIYVKPARKYF